MGWRAKKKGTMSEHNGTWLKDGAGLTKVTSVAKIILKKQPKYAFKKIALELNCVAQKVASSRLKKLVADGIKRKPNPLLVAHLATLKVTRREGETLGCGKNSAISWKFEIRSRAPGIIVVRYEFWIVRLEVGFKGIVRYEFARSICVR